MYPTSALCCFVVCCRLSMQTPESGVDSWVCSVSVSSDRKGSPQVWSMADMEKHSRWFEAKHNNIEMTLFAKGRTGCERNSESVYADVFLDFLHREQIVFWETGDQLNRM